MVLVHMEIVIKMYSDNNLADQNQPSELESMHIALDQMSQTIEVMGNVIARLQLQLATYQQHKAMPSTYAQTEKMVS